MNGTLQKIIDNGLMVRQIPKTVSETYSYMPDHSKFLSSKGRKILNIVDCEHVVAEDVTPEMWQRRLGTGYYVSEQFRYDNGKVYRKFTTLTYVPKHAGMWMSKPCRNTNSTVQWDIKHDNVFPTLEEAVDHAVEVLKKC